MHTIMENMNKEDLLALADPDPELAEILSKTPYVETFDVATDIPHYRTKIKAARRALQAAEPPSVTREYVEEDTKIPMRDGQLISIRIHRPRVPPEDGSPVFVVYHGGGFVLGDLYSEAQLCRLWTELGGTAVNVEYRLAPEWKWPVAVEDAFDALKWTASHIEDLGVNPSKGFLLGGISAGGNLTAIVSHLYRDSGLSPPLTGCYISISSTCAPSVLSERWKDVYLSRTQNANAPMLSAANMDLFFKHSAPDATSPLCSPLLFPTHEALPPSYLQVCGLDLLRDEGLIYERVLREAGVKTKMHIYPGLPHCFWAAWPEAEFTRRYRADCRVGLKWLLEMSGERGKVGRVWRDEGERRGSRVGSLSVGTVHSNA